MATIKREDGEHGKIKFSFEVSVEETQPFLENAAKALSEESSIPGFRPGKAGYDVVKTRFGEMKIMEAALEPLVRKFFVEALVKENIETVGSPSFDVQKMAPGNPIEFTAEVMLMPTVTRLADFRKLEVQQKPVELTDDDLKKALDELKKMQTKEVRGTKEDAATKEDKVVVDLSMKKDNVAVEGGEAKGYAVYLAEPHYIPGFSEQLIGMKEGEQKTFTLEFPKDHYQKHLAGAPIAFEVTLHELYHLDHPDVDDAFASSIGVKDLQTLTDLLKKNMLAERENEEALRQERLVLEEVAKQSSFSEIPELLVNEEVNKMIHELEHSVTQNGMAFEDYVQSIGKTLAQMKLDFTPQALNRIKVVLILRAIADAEKVTVPEKDIDEELDRVAAQYEDPELKKKIYSPAYREYIATSLRNKKTVELLKGVMVK